MKKNVIKMISILMALGMLCAVIPCGVMTYAEGTETVFTDVAPDDWFYGDVEYVNEKGLMKGVAEATFAPDAPLSRAMCATILYRMAGEPDVSRLSNVFTDVPEGTWYTDAAKWGRSAGIIYGKEYYSLAPGDNITRAEFATMLCRYADHKALGLPENREYTQFADEKDIPDYAETQISLLYCSEVINGKPGNKFAPNDNSTRAEAAAMLRRFSENSDGPDTEWLAAHGLEMDVMMYINREPYTKYNGSFRVSFLVDDKSSFDSSTVSIEAEISNGWFETSVKLNEYPVPMLYKDVTFGTKSEDMKPLELHELMNNKRIEAGHVFTVKMTVTIAGESRVFYCYPRLKVAI